MKGNQFRWPEQGNGCWILGALHAADLGDTVLGCRGLRVGCRGHCTRIGGNRQPPWDAVTGHCTPEGKQAAEPAGVLLNSSPSSRGRSRSRSSPECHFCGIQEEKVFQRMARGHRVQKARVRTRLCLKRGLTLWRASRFTAISALPGEGQTRMARG